MAGGIGEDSHDGHGDLWNHLLKQGSWCITIPNNAVLREYPSKLPYILHCLIPPQNGCFYDPCFVKCFNNHHTYISYGRSFHTSPLGPQKERRNRLPAFRAEQFNFGGDVVVKQKYQINKWLLPGTRNIHFKVVGNQLDDSKPLLGNSGVASDAKKQEVSKVSSTHLLNFCGFLTTHLKTRRGN